ncbi:MAG: efflux RND transporter permease subunit [Lentisphaeria bacterium]|nr:efflux RND transporter permease subunit [Lentisphaeria bacterium]
MIAASFSVSRPLFITMIGCIVIVLGGISLKYLPVDLFPEIDFPSVSLNTKYTDASPEEVEELITRPLERSISAVTGIKEIYSVSGEENSSITVKFTWGTNLDEAVSDIRDKIDRAMRNLPDDVDRPTLRRFNSASMPIMRLGVSTDMDLLKAKKLLEDQVQYRLERINGVASANIFGGLTREIQVLLDVDKAKTLNVSLETILAKLQHANVTTPAGNLKSGTMEVRMRTIGAFDSLDQLRELYLAAAPDGSGIRLRDVAEVRDTNEEVTNFVRVNGKPGIFIGIYKQSGSNTVAVADAVKKELEKINEDMHNEFRISAVSDSSKYIRRSIDNVANSAITGGLLAIVILFLFLCNLRSTMIIAISIPLSVVATFVLVYFCGYTINIMTLGGLALGVGMLVDNSIVVLENIVRLHDGGMPRREAAVKGTEEVTGALIASTFTTVAVFLPLVFTQGIAGVMFKQLAMVIVFSLLCSLVSALTLVPMLAGHFLAEDPSGRARVSGGRFFRRIQRGFSRFSAWYAILLERVLQFRIVFILLILAVLGASCFLALVIGTEMMPPTDEGEIQINYEDAVGTSPSFINRTLQLCEPIVHRICGDNLINLTSRAGASSWRASGGHKGTYSLELLPRSRRKITTDEVCLELNGELNKLPGTTFRVRPRRSFMGGGSSGTDEIKLDIRGYDFKTADELGRRAAEIARTIAGVTDVQLSRDEGTPEQRIAIDREKAETLNLSVKTIADALRTILAGSEAGNYRERGDEYTIRVKVKDADRMTVPDVMDMTVQNGNGENVILQNVVTTKPTLGPVTIERKNQQRVLTVTANLLDRDMGSAVEEFREKLRALEPLPSDFSISFSGAYEDQQETFRELLFAFILALILVYMVMVCQFESLKDPLIVMFSVPLASIGVISALILTKTTFNMQSFIGCIMLAGIVVNNAILLIDTANLLRRRDGMSLHLAIRTTGRRRLRPILMTTLTTVLGLVPLALGLGDGGEAQAPLARVVIGGLTTSTIITLFFIPAAYSLLEGMQSKKKKKGETGHAAAVQTNP